MQLTIKDSNKHFFTRIQIEREKINNKLVTKHENLNVQERYQRILQIFSSFCCLTNGVL